MNAQAVATSDETGTGNVETPDDIGDLAAGFYRNRLRDFDLPQSSTSFEIARSALVESIDRALHLRMALAPSDVSYNAGLCLPLLETGEWRYLDNQWAEGTRFTRTASGGYGHGGG